jgi:hypothetical protein
VRDFPNLPRSGRMFGWFSHPIETLDLHQCRCAHRLNHLLPCPSMFFFFVIFRGIFGLILDFAI